MVDELCTSHSEVTRLKSNCPYCEIDRLKACVAELEAERDAALKRESGWHSQADELYKAGARQQAQLEQANGLLRELITIRTLPPITDRERELYEELYWELRTMYQRNVLLDDNGIPFRQALENYVSKIWKPKIDAFLSGQPVGQKAESKERLLDPLWKKLKRVCQLSGVALEYIPYDDQCYEVFAIAPDSRQIIAKSHDELAALDHAIRSFKRLNQRMEGEARHD